MRKLIKQNAPFLFILLMFAIAVIVLLGYYGKIEAQLLANSYHSSFFDSFFFWSTKVVELFSLLVFLAIFLFKGAKLAINGVIIYGINALIIRLLKVTVFDTSMRPTFNNSLFRLIPDEFGMTQLTNNSFPSGHTAAAFTLFCFLTLISKNKNLGYLFGIFAVIIGYSRIYLSQHYFEDILAGATIGTFLTFILFYFLDKINYGSWADKPLIRKK